MPELKAWKEQREHRHTWVTVIVRDHDLGLCQVCSCGATRRIELREP
jgi:hypothetical protein